MIDSFFKLFRLKFSFFKASFKRFFNLTVCFLFFLVFSVCFFGCSKVPVNNKSSSNGVDGKLKVVSTIFPLYDLVRQVAANDVDLKMLMSPGVDSHTFEPRSEDVKLIENCDVLVYLGGNDDLWVEQILNSFSEEKKNKIKPINIIKSLGYSLNDIVDSHVWTSFSMASKIAQILEINLSNMDSKRSSVYLENLNLFRSKLNELKHKYEQVVENGQRRVLVFADRFPFKHFINEFNLEVKTPFVGCSSKSEALSSKVSELVKFIKTQHIPLVLKTDSHDGGLAEVVASETGVKVGTFFACHTVSAQDFSKGKTYLNFMEQNLETLKEALN